MLLVRRLLVSVVLSSVAAVSSIVVSSSVAAQERPLDVHLGFDGGSATSIDSHRLGAILAEGLIARFGTDMRPLSVGLRLALFEAERGGVARYHTDAVPARPGQAIRGWTWITEPEELEGAFAPGFGDRRKIRIGRIVSARPGADVPRECADVSHAVRVALFPDGERAASSLVELWICLDAEG